MSLPAIKQVPSPHFYPQNGIAKQHITLHWMVGSLDSTDRAFTGTRAASSTYGVNGSDVHQYVSEKDYAFSDGNTFSNRYGISIEHEGGWLQTDGTRFTPSDATHEMSAQLCADIARRHGWHALTLGGNVFPHSHWVATACPGTLDLQRIVDRANAILGAAATVQVASTGAAGLLAVDGDRGALTIRAEQRALGVSADGNFGPISIRAEQARVGVKIDGQRGPLTIKGVQRHVGAAQDGSEGPATIRAEQAHLNAGTF